MPGITNIEDALHAVELNKARLTLLEDLEGIFRVPEANEWTVSPKGYPPALDVVRYKAELRALVIRELRESIASLDKELRELGIDPDA